MDHLYRLMIGVGGIGTGMFFALEGDATLGRNESRPGRLLDVRDYCKLHIISHYVARLLTGDVAETRDGPHFRSESAGKSGVAEEHGPWEDIRPAAAKVGSVPSFRVPGFRVLPIGKVGDDAAGRRLIEEMAAAGMDVSRVEIVGGVPTTLSVCFQYPDGSGGNITTSNGAAALLTAADVDAAEPVMAEHAGRFIALAAPEVPLAARLRLLELAGRHGGYRVAAIASAEAAEAVEIGLLRHVDLLAVNEDEAAALSGEPFELSRIEPFLESLTRRVTELADGRAIRILMSAGKTGAFAYDNDRWDFAPAIPVKVASTAGAGDALVSGTIAGIVMGLPFALARAWRTTRDKSDAISAVDLGTALAAMSVTSPHTIHPEADLSTLVVFAGQHGLDLRPLLRHTGRR